MIFKQQRWAKKKLWGSLYHVWRANKVESTRDCACSPFFIHCDLFPFTSISFSDGKTKFLCRTHSSIIIHMMILISSSSFYYIIYVHFFIRCKLSHKFEWHQNGWEILFLPFESLKTHENIALILKGRNFWVNLKEENNKN